jgi:hypothetical protein
VAALGIAVAGLPLLVVSHLAAVLTGLSLVGVGTFFAQAVATVSSAARQPPTAARRAASTSHAISSGPAAAPCSDRSSIVSAGAHAWLVSAWRSRSPRRSPEAQVPEPVA